MSEYYFGVSRIRPTIGGKKPATARRKLREIAERHGCDFIETTLPGTGYQRWFAGPNRGFPFDRRMEEAVYADMEAEGID